MRIILALAFGFLSLCAVQLHAQTNPSSGEYSVTKVIHIGGEGRWDYVSVDENHLLYVTRSTHTQIIDPASGKVTADIAGGGGLHGVAVAPTVGRAFITDGRNAQLLVVDLKTNALLGKMHAAEDADGIIYDSGTDRVLVACGDAGQLLVVDPKADIENAKPESIDLDGKPEFFTADGKGHAFVCINDKNVIAEVDIAAKKVINRWPCGSGTSPTGIAIDPKGGHLFVGCRNQKLIVMSTDDGKVQGELPIGRGNDACGFDPGTNEAFASCGDGTVTVVRETTPGQFGVTQTITTKPGARTMTVDPATHTLYLPTAEMMPAEQGKRPAAKPDTFMIVVVSRPG